MSGQNPYRKTYEPSFLQKLFLVVTEQLYCFLQLLVNGVPFARSVLHTHLLQSKDERLPGKISDLLDPKTFSRLSGRPVSKVEYSFRLEQHANSTDRAWFKVRYDDQEDDAHVFAKVQAKNVFVRTLMCIFDVYRNEINTYSSLEMPVVTPRVHIAKWTPSRFVLALEDLRHEEVEFTNIWETVVDVPLAQQVLSSLAKIHAKWWNCAPDGCWKKGKRPYMPKLQGILTLYSVDKRCPGLIPPDFFQMFKTALWHFDQIRAFLDRSTPKTMVHGDSHMGNFYIRKDGVVGAFDFQVNSEEHPMRDVTYFLGCSYPEENLARDEKDLIRFYLTQLQQNGVPQDSLPTFEECWLQYRMQSFYTMYAFIFSGGVADLMDAHQTRCGVKRIIAQMQRVDSAGALYDLLDGKI